MRRREDRDSYDRRDYRDTERRDERVRHRSRSPSTSRNRRRSRSPAAYERRTYSHHQRTSYRDLDRPGPPKTEMKDMKRDRKEEKIDRKIPESKPVEQEILEGDEDAQLAAFLGITSFASTKGQKVKGNEHNEAVDTTKKRREYRQYLYVKGSYDIPLTQDQLEAKEKEQREQMKQF